MSESRSHKITANRIAKKLKTNYTPEKGIDINSPKMAVEVETQGLVSEGIRQLQGHKNLLILLLQIRKRLKRH